MTIDQTRLAEHLDKLEIAELVRLERHRRDTGAWDKLAGSYIEDSHIRTTWFSGTAREFAEHARALTRQGGGRPSKHLISPVEIRIAGDRAVVESVGEIHNRDTLEGIPIDTIQYCRFVSRVVRTADGWRLASFEGIYQKDVMTPVFPGDVIPIDREEMSRLRPPYQLLAYRLARKGLEVPQGDEIVAEDRPELVEAFLEDTYRWLREHE
ncbi:nuclear transport factor 2 family protein [Streptomyces sp. NPDC093544]|uniref:nuclear transport factor 2 family protein n=1 Tax=Streptomyces sp. NPDC093544 TaxID=3155200 RepID=UPI003437A400